MKNCIDYILNPEKTENGRLTGFRGCSMISPSEDMIRTLEDFGKASDSKRCRLAYHFTISFKSGDGTTRTQAMENAEDFCRKYLGDYQAVYSVHTDREHMHCHVVFNAASYIDGKKYHYDNGDWARDVQPLLDDICTRHGCHTLEKDTGIPISGYEKDRKTRRRRSPGGNGSRHSYYNEKEQTVIPRSRVIKNDIDECILLSSSFEEFLGLLGQRGYQIKCGDNVKHMAVRRYDDGQNRRLDTLDKSGYYSEDMIKKRILDKNKPLPVMPVNSDYRFIVPHDYRVIRLPKRPLNKYEKRCYARMYRLGMRKKTQWTSYREIRGCMKEIRDIAARMQMMSQQDSLEQLRADYEKEQSRLETALEDNRQKQKTFRLLFSAANKLRQSQTGYLAWQKGDESCREAYGEYVRCTEYLHTYGYSAEEAMKLKESLKTEQKQLKKQLRQSLHSLDLLEQTEKELRQEPDPEEIHQLDQTYRELEEQDRKEQQKQEQKGNNIRR